VATGEEGYAKGYMKTMLGLRDGHKRAAKRGRRDSLQKRRKQKALINTDVKRVLVGVPRGSGETAQEKHEGGFNWEIGGRRDVPDGIYRMDALDHIG